MSGEKGEGGGVGGRGLRGVRRGWEENGRWKDVWISKEEGGRHGGKEERQGRKAGKWVGSKGRGDRVGGGKGGAKPVIGNREGKGGRELWAIGRVGGWQEEEEKSGGEG